MWDVIHRPVFLVSVSALGYAAATIAMKAASTNPGAIVLMSVFVCLAAAVLAEITLLRGTHLGLSYIAILAVETLIVLTIAGAIGEGLGPRDVAGALLVLLGAGIISA